MPMVSPRGNCRIGGTIATRATTSDLMRLRLSAEMISWSDASSLIPVSIPDKGGQAVGTFQCSRTKFLKKRAAAWRMGRATSFEAMRLSRPVRKSARVFASVFNVASAAMAVSTQPEQQAGGERYLVLHRGD